MKWLLSVVILGGSFLVGCQKSEDPNIRDSRIAKDYARNRSEAEKQRMMGNFKFDMKTGKIIEPDKK